MRSKFLQYLWRRAGVASAGLDFTLRAICCRSRPAASRPAEDHRFVEKLAIKVKGIKVGNDFEAFVDREPMIDDNAITRIESHVADALARGAKLLTGGKKSGERLYEPTVLTEAARDMPCPRPLSSG